MAELLHLPYFTTVEGLTNDEVHALIERAEEFKHGEPAPTLSEPVYVTNMFFENSTRTHNSFAMAERKLGLQEITFDAGHSSVSKGESMYDTCLTMSAIGINLAVIRDQANDYYRQLTTDRPANSQLDLGIINAGDGSGQHPSQCLLDMMTIHEQFGHFDGLKVAIVGDITNSRVAKSNMQLLHRLGAQIYFAGPEYWFSHEFDEYGQYVNLDDILDQLDVLMLLRVQHERHDDQTEAQFDVQAYCDQYGINQARYDRLPERAIICHPGPINRDVEIVSELVEAPKSFFYQQMQNGVFMRMAMLEAVMRGRHLGGLA